jgi:inner membrane protein
VKFGDSVWSAKGPDLSVGSRARIVSVDGSVLTVEGV